MDVGLEESHTVSMEQESMESIEEWSLDVRIQIPKITTDMVAEEYISAMSGEMKMVADSWNSIIGQ